MTKGFCTEAQQNTFHQPDKLFGMHVRQKGTEKSYLSPNWKGTCVEPKNAMFQGYLQAVEIQSCVQKYEVHHITNKYILLLVSPETLANEYTHVT